MPLYEPVVHARYAELLLNALRPAPPGVLEAAVVEARVDQALLHRRQTTLTIAQFDSLLKAMTQYSGRSDLGFEIGLAVKLEDHPAIGLVLRQCRTLDTLLRQLVRFSRLMSPSFSLGYQRSQDHGEFTWRPAAYMSTDTLRTVEEAVAVALHCELEIMLGDRLTGCDIYLSIPAPAHRARYLKLRPTRFHFANQALPEVRLVMSTALLDLPLTQPEMQGELLDESELRTRQRAIARVSEWAGWVSMILREAEGCQPSRRQLAELLSISEPTLGRQLAKEGLCFRELGKTIRHERAIAMLHEQRQSISQIAYRLGYRDAANFSHSFRAISGISPRAYRAKIKIQCPAPRD